MHWRGSGSFLRLTASTGCEWDHVDPCANGGETSVANLKPECKPHHWEKTERDRKAGLLGRSPPARAP
jgi:hypothetical protein